MSPDETHDLIKDLRITEYPDAMKAADLIESLQAERDTLAEMVRKFRPYIEHKKDGSPMVRATYRWGAFITPAQAERFRVVLDTIGGESHE